ncbi:hypothetical protein PIB30_096862 [Stylosanthes scabra]|uniref:Uncharacterized protein n=1 Tax=Stylosanthes scabra TaxID=79078 RepID=A0ABU6ZUU9_9FABA|nr:hypothetical protein [Stylosanthes scabra]
MVEACVLVAILFAPKKATPDNVFSSFPFPLPFPCLEHILHLHDINFTEEEGNMVEEAPKKEVKATSSKLLTGGPPSSFK